MINSDWNGTITFNGRSSTEFGMIVEKLPVLRRPRRKGSVVSVPGSNGSIAMETGGFETYIQPYEVAVTNLQNGVAVSARNIADWLLNSSGFLRLEDSFEPDVFRMARFSGPFDIEPVMDQDGKATIEFEVQPQRYLKIGENQIRFSQNTTSGNWYINVQLKDVHSLVVSYTGDDVDGANINLYEAFPEDGDLVTVMATDGRIEVDPSDYDGSAYLSAFIQGSGSTANETTCGVYLNGMRVFAVENGTAYLYNPTNYEARPLIVAEAVDAAAPVARTIAMNYSETILETGYHYHFYNHPLGISSQFSVNGFSFATVTTKMTSNGCIYAFYDSDGNMMSGRWGKAGETVTLNAEMIKIPSGANKMVVGAYDEAKTYVPTVTVTAAGNAIHGFYLGDTFANIRFSQLPAVILDSELRDARYEDGSSANSAVQLTNVADPYESFPVLAPKRNAVSADNTEIVLWITPRWWVL